MVGTITQKINHTRIKNFCKKFVDCKISTNVYPILEKFIIKEVNKIISDAIEFMKTAKRKTLYVEDLKLSKRYYENGKERNFTDKEIREIIKESLGRNYKIQNGVLETIKGYLYEILQEKVMLGKKLLDFSPDRMLSSKHMEIYI